MRCDILSIYQWRSFYRTNKQTNKDKTWHCAAHFVSVFFLGFLRFMVNCISSSSLRFVRLASMEGGQKGQRCERSTQRKRSMSERRDGFDEEERRSLVLLTSSWKTCTQTRRTFRKNCRNIEFQRRDGEGEGRVKYDTKMLRYPMNP